MLRYHRPGRQWGLESHGRWGLGASGPREPCVNIEPGCCNAAFIGNNSIRMRWNEIVCSVWLSLGEPIPAQQPLFRRPTTVDRVRGGAHKLSHHSRLWPRQGGSGEGRQERAKPRRHRL